MNQYLTVKEIAEQWEVKTRTVQYLCKKGKIEGVIKRAGVWFVPDDAPNPFWNDSSDVFAGTKLKIFDRSIELFMLYGYENVSVNDIADAVGIMQSAIYNHFSSKKEILDKIYDYYVEHFNDNQRSVEEMQEIMKNSTREEFSIALAFTFETDDEVKYKRMLFITKIVYMRIFHDERARDIFSNMMNREMEEYIIEILKEGISAGIFEEFDIETYAKFVIGQRHIMGVKAYITPEYIPQQLEEEERIMKMCGDILPYKAEKN